MAVIGDSVYPLTLDNRMAVLPRLSAYNLESVNLGKDKLIFIRLNIFKLICVLSGSHQDSREYSP